MTRAFALLVLVLASAPAHAQDDPEPTPAERFAEVESTSWDGVLANLETISAMLDRLETPTGTRMRQDSLVRIATTAETTRGALFVTLQFTATRTSSDDFDEAMQPVAEASLGLLDLLGQTASEALEDALHVGTAAKALDGPARATRIRELADVIRQNTAALGITLP